MRDRAPNFSKAEAAALVGRVYGLEGSLSSLPSYEAQNFLIKEPSGQRWVLKVAPAGHSKKDLDLQNRVMEYLARAWPQLQVPKIRRSLGGRSISSTRDKSGWHLFLRLFTFVDGVPLSAGPAPSYECLAGLGRMVASLDRALEDFSDPHLERSLPWDLCNFSHVQAHLGELTNPKQRRMVERVLEDFERQVVPELENLPRGVIHGDVNNDNVLLNAEGIIVGLLDFEDVVRTARVFEIAISMAYMMLGRDKPLEAGARMLSGYQEIAPLRALELDLLDCLVRARLAMSATHAARLRRLSPANRYAFSNEKAAWSLLEELIDRSPGEASSLFERPPNP